MSVRRQSRIISAQITPRGRPAARLPSGSPAGRWDRQQLSQGWELYNRVCSLTYGQTQPPERGDAGGEQHHVDPPRPPRRLGSAPDDHQDGDAAAGGDRGRQRDRQRAAAWLERAAQDSHSAAAVRTLVLPPGFTVGWGETIADGSELAWTLDPRQASWLLLGVAAFTYTWPCTGASRRCCHPPARRGRSQAGAGHRRDHHGVERIAAPATLAQRAAYPHLGGCPVAPVGGQGQVEQPPGDRLLLPEQRG